MALSTYAELVAELEEQLNRLDLTARIPVFIRLFEAKINRRLRSPDMEQTFSFTTVSGTLSYSINSRVRELRKVYATTTSDDTDPENYTIEGETIVFDEDPGDDLTIYYSGYVTLAGLGDSNTTNWLLDDHPDAYLMGTLARAHFAEKDYEAAELCEGVVDSVIEEIKREANQKRMPAGPLQSAPAVRE
jgi:hypothetical protein